MRFHIAVEVVRHEVVVTVIDDAVAQRGEAAGVAEHVGFDGLEDFGEVGVEGEFAVVVGVAEVFDVLGQIAEEEDVGFANFAGDFDLEGLLGDAGRYGIGLDERRMELTFAPSHVPMTRPPLRTNFMLLVPEASVPAVEICSLMSEAGVRISALLTL